MCESAQISMECWRKKGERERNRLEKGSRCGWAYTCQRQQRFFEFSTRNTDRISRNTVGSSGKTSLSVVPSLHVLPPPPGRMNTFATFRRPLERRRLAAAQRGNNKDAWLSPVTNTIFERMLCPPLMAYSSVQNPITLTGGRAQQPANNSHVDDTYVPVRFQNPPLHRFRSRFVPRSVGV